MLGLSSLISSKRGESLRQKHRGCALLVCVWAGLRFAAMIQRGDRTGAVNTSSCRLWEAAT